MITWLLVAHIAVLGYWLGSELVINATYRYVCYHDEMALGDRSRLMDHVMHVDQHVRYALVLEASLGLMLCAKLGYLPGGQPLFVAAALAGVLWLIFVELVHRLRTRNIGHRLASIDRASRYALLVILLAVAAGWLGSGWHITTWLRWKLALFAGVIACGIGIRLALIQHFTTWAAMTRDGVSASRNHLIKRTYVRATSVLVLLWVFIAGIVVLSVMKPA